MSQVAASLKNPLALSMESISERPIFHYHALMPKASSCIYLWHTGTTAHMLPLRQIEKQKPENCFPWRDEDGYIDCLEEVFTR